MMKLVVFTVLCLYYAQASIQGQFEVVKKQIDKTNHQALNEFIEYATAKANDYNQLANKITALHLTAKNFADSYNGRPCAYHIAKAVAELEADLQADMKTHGPTQSILKGYTAFTKTLIENFGGVEKISSAFKACADDECKASQVEALGELNNDEPLRLKDELVHLIENMYPEVDVIIKEYQAKVQALDSEYATCIA